MTQTVTQSDFGASPGSALHRVGSHLLKSPPHHKSFVFKDVCVLVCISICAIPWDPCVEMSNRICTSHIRFSRQRMATKVQMSQRTPQTQRPRSLHQSTVRMKAKPSDDHRQVATTNVQASSSRLQYNCNVKQPRLQQDAREEAKWHEDLEGKIQKELLQL